MAAIYLDAGSNFITVRDNVGVNIQDSMLFQNANGTSNTLINNGGSSPSVIANAGVQPLYQDILAPSATFAPVTPDPRNTAVGLVTLFFNEPVTGVSLSDFQLRRNGVVVSLSGVTLAGSGMAYTIDLTSVSAPGGTYELRLVAAGSGIASTAYPLAVDAVETWTMDVSLPRVTVVTVDDGTTQRSRIRELRVVFSEVIQYVGEPSAAFTLAKLTGGNVSLNVTTVIVGNFTEAILTFLSDSTFGSLNDGRYTLTVHANQIRDLASNQLNSSVTTNFHRFFGDSNGDGNVDIADFSQFTSTYGLNSAQPGFRSYFDYNNDGVIDIADFGQFSIRMFTILP
jgi:hypothetical protein